MKKLIEKCFICGNKLNRDLLGIAHGGYRLCDDSFVCHSCATTAGLIGKKGTFLTKIYSKKDFREKYDNAYFLLDKKSDTRDKVIENLKSFVVLSPTIRLKENEKCFVETFASSVYLKNVVLGTFRTSFHSGSQKNGKYFGLGNSYTKSIRGNVSEKYQGTLYLTNQRIVLNAIKYGFEIPLSKISSFEFFNDGFVVYSNGNSYLVETNNVMKIKTLLSLNNRFETIYR